MNLITFLAFGFAMVVLTSAAVQCPTGTEETSIYLPHETDCGKFYECSSRQPILFECAPGTYFDPKQNVCDWKVDCGNLRTSTAAPQTTTGQ